MAKKKTSKKKSKQKNLWIGIVAIVILLIFISNQSGRTSRNALVDLSPTYVMDVGFNDDSDPWKDSTTINSFTNSGAIYLSDDPNCLWYGCARMSGNAYIKTISEHTLGSDGFAIEFWVKHNQEANDNVRPGYFWWKLGPNDWSDGITSGEDNQGLQWAIVDASGTKVNSYYIWSQPTRTDTWVHYFYVYDPVACTMTIYGNGNPRVTEQRCLGPMTDSSGLEMRIGTGRYWESGDFYIDEFTAYNDISGITPEYIEARYNLKRAGTPPELDVYVKNIKYEIPYDWDVEGNPLITGGTMPIIIELANAGLQDSQNFGYSVDLESGNICSGTTSVAAGGVTTITCDWNTRVGFQKGFVTLDISDTVAENNEQRLYIPFMDRPYYHYTEQEWDDYISYADQFFNDGSVVGSSVGWMSHFSCSEFNPGYSGDNVDPYGPKGMECMMGCAYNDYDMSRTMCQRGMEHLAGWLAIDPSSYQGVQQIHYLNYVGMTYDISQSYLTKAENDVFVEQMHALSQRVTNHPDTRPDLDSLNGINGGNGWGFGSGMGGFTYNTIGVYPENPTLIQRYPESYWGKNIPDLWMNREDSFLSARKDEPFSFYQEGVGYKYYAESLNFMFNVYFRKRFDLGDMDQYNNAFCAQAKENIVNILDMNYDGVELRNSGFGTHVRQISRGDGSSYDQPQGMLNWDSFLFNGLMCDDMDVKENMLWLRDKVQEVDGGWSYFASFAYSELISQTGGVKTPPQNNFPRFNYDNANDIAVIRDGYTYEDDTLLLIDGGEERGSGHSQAQGYFLYINGVPFFDYEQVPYEDDVRSDPWKNGVSFVTAPQTQAGTGGAYRASCGDTGFNQYYGMGDCPQVTRSSDYPEYRRFPFHYGGDVEDYIGSEDGTFGGAYVWRPYSEAEEPIREYFVKFGDLVAKRTVVERSSSGQIYHNFISINNEIDMIEGDNKFALNADGTWVETQVAWSDVPMTLGGGDSGVQVCYCKTGCEGSCGGTSNYRRMYYQTNAQSADFIITHSWNTGTPPEVNQIGVSDKGVRQGTKFIVFDTNADGIVEYDDWSTDGWALVYDESEDQAGAFNATYVKKGSTSVLSAQQPIAMYVDDSVLTKNTATLNDYMDREENVLVFVNGIPDGPICTPSTEVCDGIDNDCDDLVDEDLQRTCSVNSNNGVQECSLGVWGDCVPTSISAYSCVEDMCVVDVNGLYSSGDNCLDACQTVNETSNNNDNDVEETFEPDNFPYYGCTTNGMCVEDTNGAYLTSDCNSECVEPKNDYDIIQLIVIVAIVYFFVHKREKSQNSKKK